MDLFGKAAAAPVGLPVEGRDETQDALPTQGEYGLAICHDGGDDALADIVFVHGLTGNRHNTWTHKGNDVFWPKDILPRDLPKTRIMTYGYDADIAHFWAMASQNRIGEHAGNLVNAITQIRERTDTERRPVIFITHSLGGLVTEDALLFSKNSAEEHLQDLVQSVVGICFLGTPHCGSDLARWGSIMGSLVNAIKTANVNLVNILKTDSEVLARVQREFHTMLRGPTFEKKPALKITCFFEELPLRGIGEIVPKHSAILPSYNAIGIRANHMEMTKFSGPNDAGYMSVSGELRRWVKAIAKDTQEAPRVDECGFSYPRQHDRAGRYPYGSPPRQPSPYSQDSRGYQQYMQDMYRHGESEFQGHGSGRNDYAPHYERYRSGAGYSRPPPPPEPKYVEAEPPALSSAHAVEHQEDSWRRPRSPMFSPPQTDEYSDPPWARGGRPSFRTPERLQSPLEPGSYQGASIIYGSQTTHSGGKTVNGGNWNIQGNFTL